MRQNQKKEIKRVEVPTGVAIFPKDMVSAPQEFAERIFTIHQWTEMTKGGHFTAMEQPDLFSQDIRKFAKSLKAEAYTEHSMHASSH